MEHFYCWKENGHVFAEFDGRVGLIDTGAWLSVSDRQRELGRTTTSTYNGATIVDLRKLVGVQFDFLLGLSSLIDKPFEIDLDINQFTLSSPAREAGRDVELIGGFLPVLLPSGQRRLALFDSGAQLSYLHANYAQWADPQIYRDFYPGHGELVVRGGVATIEIAGTPVTLNMAVLPTELESMTDWLRAAIIGNELLDRYAVRLDYGEQQLTLYDRIPQYLRKQAT